MKYFKLNNLLTLSLRELRLKFKTSYLLLLAAGLQLFALPAESAENTAATATAEDYYFQDMPVVLTASRLSQPLSEAPSSMTVIDRDMIKASGFRTVPELLRLVPGMYVGFADANNPVVTLHGSADMWSHRMQILIDGRSVYLPPFGTVNWADLPVLTEDIERIEVVRGPSSASHGDNSFYGVINIITRDAVNQHGGSVSVTEGYANDASARFGRTGENFDYRVSVGQRSDQGLDNGVLNDHNMTRVLNIRSNYHPTATDSVDFQLGSSNGVYGLGIAGRPEAAFRDTTAQNNFQQVSWLHSWSGGDESKLTYSYTADHTLDPYLCINSGICQGYPWLTTQVGVPISQGFVQQHVSSQRNELELQNTQQLGDANRLVWGGVMRRDYANYPLYFTQPNTLTPWQVFAHDEWRISQAAVLNVGTMFDDDGMGNQTNSPQAAFNYHLTPENTVRFGVSTATRSPAMFEAYMSANNTILGGAYVPPVSPLRPERILSKEIGYLGDFRSLGLMLDARAYIEQVSDMIWWDKYVTNGDPNSAPDSYKNLLAAEYKGVETTLKYHWDEGRSFLVFNYAYQLGSASLSSTPTQYYNPTFGTQIQQGYQSQYLGQFPQNQPTNSGSLLVSQRLAESWQFSTGYYFEGNVGVGDVSPDVTHENGMKRLDMRLAKTFKLENGQSTEVAAVVQNVTQDLYTKYGNLNAVAEVVFTRRGWVTATFNF